MFDDLQMAPPDAILGLTEAFKADPNPKKINLGVGVYKDQDGNTPVFSSVKKAEQKLLREKVQKRQRGWRKAKKKLKKIEFQLRQLTIEMAAAQKAYKGYFDQATKAFRAIVQSPKHRNTLTAYKAQFYMGQAAYFAGRYLEAARIFKAVQHSKISGRMAKKALKFRLYAFQGVVGKLTLPPAPVRIRSPAKTSIPFMTAVSSPWTLITEP